MKRTANSVQRAYMLAKAHLQALEEREAELEKAYIAANEIRNADGSTPERIYCIDDEAVFDKANAETAAEAERSGLWADILDAKRLLVEAEDNMISYGISIAPAGIRATLSKGAKENCATRQKLIDLVFRLDVSTVPR